MSKLEERIKLPTYTLGEELLNAISHGVGVLFSITALVLTVVFSAKHHNPWALASSIVYGISLIILYTNSTIYHSLKRNNGKRVFRILDHSSIFILIAGTYTPYTLVSLNGKVGWIIFGVVWACAIIGILFKSININKFKKLSTLFYVFMGWIVVFAFKPLYEVLPTGGLYLLVAGGLVYTIGAIFYAIGHKSKYMHSIFHIFVLAASILHFFSILLYVI